MLSVKLEVQGLQHLNRLAETEHARMAKAITRAVIETGIRQWLIKAAFGENAIVSGRAVAELLPRTLTSAVAALAHDRTPSLTTRVVALLDLLELEGLHVPFDAQTRFHDAFLASEGGPVEEAALDPVLQAIAVRLGFSVLTHRYDATALSPRP